MADRSTILRHFEQQIEWCAGLGSPFTAQLVKACFENMRDGGVLDGMIGGWTGEPTMDALSLRVAGALQALVRGGKAPALAALYPGAADGVTAADLAGPVAEALKANRTEVMDFLSYAVQTNEVGRSSVLLPGFAYLASRIALPFSVFEIGASAGLNLSWDRYYYDFGNGHVWGDQNSPVQFEVKWDGPFPSMPASIEIADRAAVDINPLDVQNKAAMDRVRSYIWPDQTARIARFEGAVEIARANNVQVVEGDAGTWVKDHVIAPQSGKLRVLYHSIMWQYMPKQTRQAINKMMEQAGAAATKDAPLAWMSLEPLDATSTLPTLNVRLWDGAEHDGTLYQLAFCHPHGGHLMWFDEPTKAA